MLIGTYLSGERAHSFVPHHLRGTLLTTASHLDKSRSGLEEEGQAQNKGDGV
jgi:hypothetical protein